jgi:X-X-X-Leu-X-X-Gly heptad repeat protein
LKSLLQWTQKPSPAGWAALAEGETDLAAGAADLEEGADDLAEGAADIGAGATDLAAGAADLAEGAADTRAGTADLAAGAADLAEGAADIRAGTADLAEGAADITAGAADLSAWAADLAACRGDDLAPEQINGVLDWDRKSWGQTGSSTSSRGISVEKNLSLHKPIKFVLFFQKKPSKLIKSALMKRGMGNLATNVPTVGATKPKPYKISRFFSHNKTTNVEACNRYVPVRILFSIWRP